MTRKQTGETGKEFTQENMAIKTLFMCKTCTTLKIAGFLPKEKLPVVTLTSKNKIYKIYRFYFKNYQDDALYNFTGIR